MKNMFGILTSKFRVLLCTMEQRPKVVRDLVLTCVVMYDMLRTHQVRVARAPTPADEITKYILFIFQNGLKLKRLQAFNLKKILQIFQTVKVPEVSNFFIAFKVSQKTKVKGQNQVKSQR